MTIRHFCTQFLFMVIGYAYAQNQPQFTRISEMEGLSSKRTNTFLLDSRGFLWVGTVDGLNRYDGFDFRVFRKDEEDTTSISGNFISCIHEDSNGLIWVGTEASGLNLFDPKTETFRRFSYDPGDTLGLPGVRIRSITEDSHQNVWIGFDNGVFLSKYDRASQTFKSWDIASVLPDWYGEFNRAIRDMKLDPHDNDKLWLATTAGLCAFDMRTEEISWYPHAMVSHKGTQYSVWCIEWEDENLIRAGFFGLGTDVFDTRTKEWLGHHDKDRDMRIFDLARKSDHEFWVAGRKRGVGILNTQTNDINFFESDLNNYKHPYPGFTFSVLAHGGKLWAGGRYGISFHDSQANLLDYKTLHFHDKELGRVSSAVATEGYILVGGISGEGLWEIDRQSGKKVIYNPLDAGPFTVTGLFNLSSGIFVVSDRTQLWKFDKPLGRLVPVAVKATPEISSRLFINDMAPLNDSTVLIASYYAGLLRLDLNSGIVSDYFSVENAPPAKARTEGIRKMENGDFLIVANSGIHVYHPQSETFDFLLPTSLPKKSVGLTAIERHPDGSVWAASNIGLTRMDENSELHFNTSNSGLDGQYITAIEIDVHGNLWLGTDKGLSRMNPKTYEVRNFDHLDGVYYDGLLESIGDGEFLIGTYGGYAIFHPDSLFYSLEAPTVSITSFSIFDQEDQLPLVLEPARTINLTHEENFFSFTFTSPTFSNAQKVQFAYKLQGLNKDWVYPKGSRFANFTNLSSGDYTFQVKAASADGIWGAPTSIQLRISPPFWETWWFVSLVFAFLAAIGTWLYNWRISYVVKAQELKSSFEKQLAEVEMRALRAQMNPHFLFNCLNSINSYIIKNNVDQATTYLSKFSRLIRMILQNSKSSLVVLKDELEALQLYVEMEALRFEGKFEFVINTDPGLETEFVEIPPLIIQPYVENAIWHGLLHKESNARLCIRLAKREDLLEIVVDDNGIGRVAAGRLKSKSATRNKSLGMKITQDRLAVIKRLYGKDPVVEVTDKVEKGLPTGTTVKILIPAYD